MGTGTQVLGSGSAGHTMRRRMRMIWGLGPRFRGQGPWDLGSEGHTMRRTMRRIMKIICGVGPRFQGRGLWDPGSGGHTMRRRYGVIIVDLVERKRRTMMGTGTSVPGSGSVGTVVMDPARPDWG